LLGGVVEAVSGQPWREYIQTRILDPLGMTDTLVTPDGNEHNLATGYLRGDEDYVRKPTPYAATNGFSPSASMASSVNDLAKYARFHLSKEDTGILSGHTLRDMHRIHWLDPTWESGYGLGVFVNKLDGWTMTGHSGGYNGYLTQFRLCREHDFAVIVLANALGSDPYQYVERAFKLVLPTVIEATKEKPKADPDWRKYVGTYTSDWRDREIIIRNGQLQAISLEFLDEKPTVLEPTDTPHVFKIKAPGEGGETARFEFAGDGSISRLWWNNEYSLPKGS
jgi:CubicO group peptidase (beta-lactamase class C family)